jgi:hypothetical protein
MPQNALIPQIISPLDAERDNQNLIAQKYNNRLAQQGVQENQYKLNQMGQQDADQKAIIGAWQTAGGDRMKFLENLRQTAPHLVMDAQQKMAMSDIALRKAQLDQATQLVDATAQRVGGLKSLAPEQRPLAWGSVRQQLIQMGHNPAELPEQYPGDQWVDMTLNQGMSVKEQIAAAQKLQEIMETGRHNRATEQQAGAALSETARHNRVDEGISRINAGNAATMNNLKATELGLQIQQQRNSAEGAAASFDRAIQSIEDLKKHPGLEAVVGIKNPFKGELGFGTIPGTSAADFKAKLSTLKAQVFLPQVQNLRGMGALSDAEGKKLTDAIGALDPSMSETAFKQSLDEIETSLQGAKQRAERLVPGAQQQPVDGAAPQIGAKKQFPNGKIGVWDGHGWVAQ